MGQQAFRRQQILDLRLLSPERQDEDRSLVGPLVVASSVEESSRKWKWNNEPNQPLIHCVPLGEGSPEFTNIMDSSKTKQFVLNTTRYYYRHIHRSPAYVVYSYTSAEELAIDACPDEIFYNRYIIHSAQTPLYILPTSACFITRCPRHVSRWAKDSEGRRSSFDWHEVCLAWGHP